MHAVDIILLVLIGAAVVLAIRTIRSARKKGTGCLGCGGDCASCGMPCGKEEKP